ncbi:hypothetical protein [Alkalihalobacillus trypoxylicola]|uniref:Uncharacterized protein n=1 Tax=Alkalihalobacillus trypoxylicola TaxID=519424 RepID=A0A161P7I0_9BACI|nr:hypothetical protein [Alkalihalobacillus trypoxylicola]KYG27041.1 hypothetical protein AZF04_11960 [Alkalihalobacillus trypoxylicola]
MFSNKQSIVYFIFTLSITIILASLYYVERNKNISPNEAMQALINGQELSFSESVNKEQIEDLRSILRSSKISNTHSIKIVSEQGTYIVHFSNGNNREFIIESIHKDY